MTQFASRSGVAVFLSVAVAALVLGPLAPAQSAGGVWIGPIDSGLISAPDREFGHISLLLHTSIGPKLLAWYYEGVGSTPTTKAYLFDANNLVPFIPVTQSLPSNVFCAAHSFRADGSLIVSGGLVPPPYPDCCFSPAVPACSNHSVYIFDPQTLSWTVPNQNGMHYSRFYGSQVPITTPGVVQQAGDPLILGGTADEACHIPTGPQLPGDPPLDQFDGKYVGGWEIYQAATGSWNVHGPAAGYIEASPSYPLWPGYPAYLPPYFRWYPRTHLFAKSDPTSVTEHEIVFVGGDTHLQKVYAWPGFPGPTNENRRQVENYLKGAEKIDVVAGTTWTVGQHFINAAVDPGPATCSSVLPANGFYGSSVLLHTRTGPGGSLVKNRVLAFGGSHGRWSQNTAVPRSFPLQQVMEWDDATEMWAPKAPVAEPRVFQNAVLLPDRTVLLVGGYTNDTQNWDIFTIPTADPVQSYEIYDAGDSPASCGATNWGLLPAALNRPRGYHAIAILLPNGTVLVGGGEEPFGFDNPRSRDSCEVFIPQYALGPRPAIGAAPAATGYGAHVGWTASPPFLVQVTGVVGAPSGFRVALMRPGSVTHHFDFEQRYVDLEIVSATQSASDAGGWNLMVKPPDDPTLAPPGYYMLFFVSGGIPSPSVTVHVP